MSYFDPQCQKCGLCEGRRSVCVPDDGPLSAEVLIVGQAPGKEENAQNLPFVGPAGEVIRYAVEVAGLRVRYANVCRCWPPGDRKPTAVEIKACRPYLDETIKRMENLKVVVALGDIALRTLTGKGKITQRHGNPEIQKLGERRVTVLPCVHPAFVIRSPEWADRFQAAINSVGVLIHGVDQSKVKLVKGRAAATVIFHRRRAGNRTVVAFDLETTGFDPKTASLLAVSFYTKKYEKPVSCRIDHPLSIRALKLFLQSPCIKVVHNVKFERAWARYHLGVDIAGVLEDTQLLSFRENENRAFSLESVAASFVPEVVGFKMDTKSALEAGELWEEQPEATLGMRNGVDSFATLQSRNKLVEILGKKALDVHRTFDIKVAEVAMEMEQRGIVFDRDEMLRQRKQADKDMKDAEKRAREYGLDCSISSSSQIVQCFKRYGLDTGVTTPKGGMSTDSSALKQVIRHARTVWEAEAQWAGELCQAILDWRKAKKLVSTYIVGYGVRLRRYRDHLGIIHPKWWWPGTETWRLRSSRPNVQNLPRGEFRKTVVSRYDGGTLVSVDYSQAELRVLAALSKDPVMLGIYAEGLDIHGHTAAALYGKDFTKEQRYQAKRVNFGIIYGMSGMRLVQVLEQDDIYITLEDADAYIEKWKKTYPKAWQYMQTLQYQATHLKQIESPMFRVVRHFSEVGTSWKQINEVAREGANSKIQTAASLLTLQSACLVEDRLKDGRIVDIVHDELLVDTPGDGLQEASIMQEAMLEVWNNERWLCVPGGADAKVGPNWGKMKEL